MKKALIFQGQIVEIAAAEFPVSPEMQWLDVADDVTMATHRYSGGAVVPIPAPSLSEVRAAKLASLLSARQGALNTLPPVTVAGKQYPATPEYREVITGIARRQAAGRPVPTTLRGVDGTPVTLNATLINQIDDAITAAVQAVWDKYWSKFDAANAATTVAEVEAVVW